EAGLRLLRAIVRLHRWPGLRRQAGREGARACSGSYQAVRGRGYAPCRQRRQSRRASARADASCRQGGPGRRARRADREGRHHGPARRPCRGSRGSLMAWRVSADPVKNESAIEWFRKKVPLTREQWDQLVDDAKRRAFTVSSVARLDVIADTLAALDRAIAEGTTFQEFKKDVAAKLPEECQGTVKDPAWRLETIHRTNVQSAYSAGRYEQMTDPEVVKFRPYFMFDAIIDDRTTNECKALHGVIRPQDDPYWEGRIPPLHFNCRSGLRSLRKSQAERRGGVAPASKEPSGARRRHQAPASREGRGRIRRKA